MDTDLPIPAEDRQSRNLYLVLAMVLIAGFVVLGMQWWVPINGGVDENGYLVAARSLAENGTMAVVPRYGPDGIVPTFVGDMWLGRDLGTPQERYYTKYPPGVPALMALALLAGGEEHGVELTYLLNPIGYAVGLLGVFFLARRLVGSLPALAAMTCVAFSGPIVRLFTVPGSHGISLGVLAWALYLLVRWMLGGGWVTALSAGLLCGFGGIVRSGDMSFLAPLLLAAVLETKARATRQTMLEAGLLLFGWAVPVAGSLLYNLVEVGSWSAYSATGEGSAFGLGYFMQHLGIMVHSIFWNGVAIAVLAAIPGLVVMTKVRWRLGLVMTSWVCVNILVYTSYYWAPVSELNIYSRFFLPSFPAIATAAMVLIIWPAKRPLLTKYAVPTALLLGASSAWITVVSNLALARFEIVSRNILEQRLIWMDERTPDDAVLFIDETDMLDHLQFTSDAMLYDFRLFNARYLDDLTSGTELNTLDPQRKRYLRERFLSLGQQGMTELRDKVMAGHVNAGRRVFVFSGPRDMWDTFDTLESLGLRARVVDVYYATEPQLPTMPDHWKLREIVASEK